MSRKPVEVSEERLVEEGEVAGDYLEQLLDILDFDGDIDLDVEGDRAVVSIEGGDDLQGLVGAEGEVLEAVQELTRLAVQQELGDRSRLMLDIAGWRAARREALTDAGTRAAERVRSSGEPESLEPMSPFERKIVHDAIAAVDGVRSDSAGVEPNRHVVVLPDAEGSSTDGSDVPASDTESSEADAVGAESATGAEASGE